MIDLTATYLGLTLKNPLVVSPSPLCQEVDRIRAMEDAGAAAVVLHSLFEEQIALNASDLDRTLAAQADGYAEAVSYLPDLHTYKLGPEEYLEHVRSAKAALSIPVIASLNGVSRGGWMNYAKKIQAAGADALELNIYYIPTDPEMSGAAVEEMYLDAVRAVKSATTIPVAVKVAPYFSNMAYMGRALDEAGADALVLFNRFYQPDLDIEKLEVVPEIQLSSPVAMRLALRWVAILHGRVKADLAGTNGIHSHEDVVKMLMAGATVTQMAAALYKHGIGHIKTVLEGLDNWMLIHEYESVTQMRGCLSHKNSPSPAAFERANYMKAVIGFQM